MGCRWSTRYCRIDWDAALRLKSWRCEALVACFFLQSRSIFLIFTNRYNGIFICSQQFLFFMLVIGMCGYLFRFLRIRGFFSIGSVFYCTCFFFFGSLFCSSSCITVSTILSLMKINLQRSSWVIYANFSISSLVRTLKTITVSALSS